ncbi:sensor domain-containing diguanylate cyclase [Amantichitinum ursilacus]|uniref:diguanylate cyclase n=1 Tax=Amantichitinum ursilacus TaxID=857265 RepID=A0A0N0GMW3_9NEIS|nr:sensor domain-containing diguanylate cyclase [Amantichitinum ursilacus]KPC51899.1 Response regulator PleD [Amantichitinum ursilacus]
MKLYAPRAQVLALRAETLAAKEPAPAALLELAWHVRQEEPQLAMRLLAQLENTLHEAYDPSQSSMHARAALIRAELAWLTADFAEAEYQLTVATAGFVAAEDEEGQGDTWLLGSRLAHDQSQIERREHALAEAQRYYRRAREPYRVLACDVWQAVDHCFSGNAPMLAHASQDAWAQYPEDPALCGLICYARAQFDFLSGDYVEAHMAFEEGERYLQDAGLMRMMISCIVNAGGGMGNLGDFETQALCVERALTHARPRGWPQAMGGCLYSLGDVYNALGRFDAARTAALEARQWLLPMNRSRIFVAVVTFLAEVTLRLDLPEEAHAEFEEARLAAEEGNQPELLGRIRVGLACCLSALGQGASALAMAHQVAQDSEGFDHITNQMARMAIARILVQNPDLPGPPEMQAPTPALHYLDELWQTQCHVPQWSPEDDLLKIYAEAWEQAGSIAESLRYERMRIAALNEENTRRATRQIAATSARHEAETARIEAEHQRQLLATERKRLGILESLGRIGQEITATLDPQDIFDTLARHAGAMLDVAGLRVWLLQDDVLVPTYTLEGGNAVTMGRDVPLDDPAANSARAAREGHEILVETEPGQVSATHIPGTRHMYSSLFGPLMVGTRLLGVISIQSARPHAYGELERLVFRNIAAYSAIALGNALNYRMLSVSHHKLVEAQAELERHASLDALTGLHNRRHLMLTATEHIERARNASQSLAVLMVDIDHFKPINDTYGHAAGDEALRVTADVLRSCVRPGDIVARFGGEEIVVLLPDTPAALALNVAERVRVAICANTVEFEHARFNLTVSIGVATWQAYESRIDDALRRADQALYHAKAHGRNVVKMDLIAATEIDH